MRCHRCGETLADVAPGLTCYRCGQCYPMIGTLPCLVPDPSYWKSLWLSRLDDYLEVTDTRIRFIMKEAAQGDILPRTRTRLLRLIDAKSTERTRIQALFADLKVGSLPMSQSVVPPRPENLEGRLAVLECYEHIFRDWAWGEPALIAPTSLTLVRGTAERARF